MRRRVLFIDGPLRGQLQECDRPPMYRPEPDADGLASFSDYHSTLEPRSYHFYQVVLFSRVIWIGSVKGDGPVSVIDSAHDDLWELLVSSVAKQAGMPL